MIAEGAYTNGLIALGRPGQDGPIEAGFAFDQELPLAPVLRRERVNRRLLAGADAVAVLLAAVVTGLAIGVAFSWVEIALAVFVVALAKVQGLYDRDDLVIRKSTLVEIPKLLSSAGILTVLAYGIQRSVVGPRFAETSFLAVSFLCLSAFLVVARVTARQLAGAIVGKERCLIIGDEQTCAHLAASLASCPSADLVGTVRLDELVDSDVSIRELILQLDTHRLVVAPHSPVPEDKTLQLIKYAKLAGVPISIFPTLCAAIGGSAVFDELAGSTLLGIPRFGLTRSSERVKRCFDLLGAAIALVVLAPVLIAIAAFIKLETPGPVFFRQIRVGRGGRHFSILKFRSMVDGADALKRELEHLNEAEHGLFKIADDPRLTRIGRLLRRTYLDELPQLFNVLKGEMSLVGPRPLIEEEDGLFAGGDRSRLRLTPGITGPWQVRGPMTTPLGEMAKLDYLYISNWSLWQDVLILLRTIGRACDRHGH